MKPKGRRQFLKDTAVTGTVLAGAAASMGFFKKIYPSTTSSTAMAADLPLRPPGALDEEEYLTRCTRCMRCIDACPNQALLPLDDSFGSESVGTPAIKARRQACMLCNKIEGDYLKCGEACPTGAIRKVKKTADDILSMVSMGIAKIDHELCYSYNNWSCGACIRACPLYGKAMTFGMWERPIVHEEFCVGCGLCERACIRYPQAIRVKVDAGGKHGRDGSASS